MVTIQQSGPIRTNRRKKPPVIVGVAFGILFVAAFALLVTGPNIYEGGSLEDYAAAHGDGARQTQVALVAFVLLPLAGACLIWVVAHMSRCLDLALDRPSLGGRVAMLGASVMAAGLTVAGAAASAAQHVSAGAVQGFPADPATGYGLDWLSSQVLNISLWGGSVVLVAIGIGARGTDLLPGWLLWTGIVVAPLLPIAFVFGMIPVLAFLLWVAAVGAVMQQPPMANG